MDLESYFDITLNKHQLLQDWPPIKYAECKQILFRMAKDVSLSTVGDIRIVRTKATNAIRRSGSHTASVEAREGFYCYEHEQNAAANDINWYVNFADYSLFGYYYTELFAQDEIMVAEHPILASVREFLLNLAEKRGAKFMPQTQDDDDLPSPVLIKNADRCLSINTAPGVVENFPEGIYGNNLARAPVEVIEAAATVLSPPTSVNVIAMEAPHPGKGTYKSAEIKDALLTALVAFSSAKQMSESKEIHIHSGNWGCGAFAGNKTLMYFLQIIAADWSGIDSMVFYDCNTTALAKAQKHKEEIKTTALDLEQLTDYAVSQTFPWGVSDGN